MMVVWKASNVSSPATGNCSREG